MAWFVLAVLLMAGVGYVNWQKSQAQINALEQNGFEITQDLKGQPRLLVDVNKKELALVYPDHYKRVSLSKVIASEVVFDRGKEMDENYRIQLALDGQPSIEIDYENETLAHTSLQALDPLLK